MCHHYPGQRAGTVSEGFSELKVNWWTQLTLAPIEAYPIREVAILRMNQEDEWILENRSWGFLHKSWKPTEKVNTANKFMRGKINARSETIHTTWPWKLAWRQRCVMLARGFCEPHKDGGEGLYTLPDHPDFFIPGLWDSYEGDDGKGNSLAVDSVVMLTTDANALVAENRTGRMRQPAVMTDLDAVKRYCSPEVTEHEQIAELFRPWPDDQMQVDHVPKQSKK